MTQTDGFYVSIIGYFAIAASIYGLYFHGNHGEAAAPEKANELASEQRMRAA